MYGSVPHLGEMIVAAAAFPLLVAFILKATACLLAKLGLPGIVHVRFLTLSALSLALIPLLVTHSLWVTLAYGCSVLWLIAYFYLVVDKHPGIARWQMLVAATAIGGWSTLGLLLLGWLLYWPIVVT